VQDSERPLRGEAELNEARKMVRPQACGRTDLHAGKNRAQAEMASRLEHVVRVCPTKSITTRLRTSTNKAWNGSGLRCKQKPRHDFQIT
jgi:hypothetical protein